MFNLLDNMNPVIGKFMPKMFMSFAEGDAGAGGGGSGDAGAGAGAGDAGAGSGGAGGAGGAGSGGPSFSWKSQLSPDYAKAPNFQKFPDTKEGLNEAVKSHLELERLLGHEKIPVPKSADDKDGWARFNKAMGVPEKPEGYQIPDIQVPAQFKGLDFSEDKKTFAALAHTNNLTPGQANKLWDDYTKMTMNRYDQHLKAQEQHMTTLVNQLRAEWGDAYDNQVELGQLVINKFAGDKDTEDFVTAVLVKDPRGIKFLSKLGNQFAENKIGEFGYKRFTFTPDQAQTEIDKILNDPNHPYNNGKASKAERDKAIDYVNGLYAAKGRKQ